jgi:hypothetical protein
VRRLPASVCAALREGYVTFRDAVPRMPPLGAEHNTVAFQADFVTRMRVAVRLWLARVGRELWREREDRACIAARQAGCYFAEYRRQFAHLRTLARRRPLPRIPGSMF